MTNRKSSAVARNASVEPPTVRIVSAVPKSRPRTAAEKKIWGDDNRDVQELRERLYGTGNGDEA